MAHAQEKAKIILYRAGSPSYTGYPVWLDGRKVCSLNNNKYIELEVTPGKHTLMVSKKLKVTHVYEPRTYYARFAYDTGVLRGKITLVVDVGEALATTEMDRHTLDNCQQ